MVARQPDQEEKDAATDLAHRIKSGDSTAETELIQRYGSRLRYVLLRQMSECPEDVEDVLQTTLSTVIFRLRDQGIDDPSRLGGFIYGIAKNLQRSNRRDRSRHLDSVDPDALSRIPDRGPGPELLALGSETTQIVRQLLAELGRTRGRERDREILMRLYIDDQNRDQVCRDLDIAPDHLRRVLHRAKQRLKSLLLEAERSRSLSPAVED